jgi:hypothetical protein
MCIFQETMQCLSEIHERSLSQHTTRHGKNFSFSFLISFQYGHVSNSISSNHLQTANYFISLIPTTFFPCLRSSCFFIPSIFHRISPNLLRSLAIRNISGVVIVVKTVKVVFQGTKYKNDG